MTRPPLPADESERLQALRATALLDSPPEPQFDALARLAARLCGTPIGAVALVDETRVWFKSRCGALPGEAPRDDAFCAWTILEPELLVVPDTAADLRFRDCGAVRAENPIRFYAGCPLRTAEGRALGTLCVMDHRPRELAAAERETLATLGAQVVAHLELRAQALRMRAANRELAEKEARLRAILDTAAEGIITISERGIVETFNPAAERIFGWSAAEVVGRNVAMLMPQPDAARHDGYLERYLDGGPARIIGIGRETVGRRRDGGTFPLFLAVGEVRLGAQRLFTGFVRDITEMKEIDRMKSEFVSVVSHELRTPLTSIRGSLGLLEAGAVGPLADRGAELVAIARANTDRLIRLINDILDLEKIEAGKMQLHVESVPVADTVAATLAGLRTFASQSEVELIAEVEEPPALVADRDRLVQVLTNLISNAVKFSPRGESVRVRARAAGAAVRFEVCDRGPGIPDALKPRLFGRFQQLDSSDRRQKGGSGLGLAISRAIVEQHGGRIGVDSLPGVGSTFWFELPQHRAPQARTA